MLTITSTIGNIFHDSKLMNEFNRLESLGCSERLRISRLQTEKRILRTKTDKGTDIGLVLNSQPRICHGDVIHIGPNKIIIVEQTPEKVGRINIKGDVDRNNFDLLVMVGHVIGNRHRPIYVEGGTIYFPIQDSSEIGVFKTLFGNDICNQLEISEDEIVLQPQEKMNVHEH